MLTKGTFFGSTLDIILQLLLGLHHMWNSVKFIVALHSDVDTTGSTIIDLLVHKHSLVALWLLMDKENEIL